MRATPRRLFLFWAPLAATWVMMALEGPFLAAVIARMADPTFNLAAYGVAFAFAILVEAPVIMLMTASTALVEDVGSYHRLRRFTRALNAGATGLLLLVLLPPVGGFLLTRVLALPDEVASLTYGSLWILLPWPAAIGYRRFLQGLLIRSGRTRLVTVGTVLRLVAMAGTALLLALLTDIPGAWVGAASLSAGVVAEALVTRLMAAPTVRELRATETEEGAALDLPAVVRFYYPLALTSFIGLTVQPLLTFFMGRSPQPIESLAVFPVVHALSFLFRALGISYQEVAIALLGREEENREAIARFGAGLAFASSAGLALVALTPLADVWYRGVSGLPAHLADFAVIPTIVLIPLPALSVLLSYQRARLVRVRRTGPITLATVLEVVVIAAAFPILAWGIGFAGVTAAMASFVLGRLAGNLLLARPAARPERSPLGEGARGPYHGAGSTPGAGSRPGAGSTPGAGSGPEAGVR